MREAQWTQADVERENIEFGEWFKKRGYPEFPHVYNFITENAMHHAWQEAAKRAFEREANKNETESKDSSPAK